MIWFYRYKRGLIIKKDIMIWLSKLLNPFYLWFIIIKYILFFIILLFIGIMPIVFLGNLWPIIEPDYIYLVSNFEAVSFTLKIITIYIIILTIYSILYYILRKDINKIINNKIDNLFNIKSLKNKNDYEKKIELLDNNINEGWNIIMEIYDKIESYKLNEKDEKEIREIIDKWDKELNDLILEKKEIKHNIFILNLSDLLKYKIIYYFIFLYIITFIVDNFILLIFK